MKHNLTLFPRGCVTWLLCLLSSGTQHLQQGGKKAIKLMHSYSVTTIMGLCLHSVPLMLFDLMQGRSGVRSNGDFTPLPFQGRGSSWPAVNAQPGCICIPAEVEVRSPVILQQRSNVALVTFAVSRVET